MTTQYDANLLYQFLSQTPESALKKMLITSHFSDTHFSLMMKIVRCCNEDQFCNYFYQCQFPKNKYNAKEISIKENFWDLCVKALNQHGLLQPAQKSAA